MFAFHKDKSRYFNIQYQISKRFIIPFISLHREINPKDKVLEIGCAEAGVLKAFLEMGNPCVGIELQPARLALAKKFLANYCHNGQVELIDSKIEDLMINEIDSFDIVILKDVIEHIHDQEKFLSNLKKMLKPDGLVFFAFPPWQMPFGGHQQVLNHKIGSKIPWTHLLPNRLYRIFLNSLGESEKKIENVMEIKETGLSIDRFEKICKKINYEIVLKQGFISNPIYKYKFGWPTIKQSSIIFSLPILRNFISSCAYYLIKLK